MHFKLVYEIELHYFYTMRNLRHINKYGNLLTISILYTIEVQSSNHNGDIAI